jgi:phthalate 4,5-dioxygenase
VLTVEENDLLCRVEGDAPMGQLMRRHWIPACMSEEVAEPDGTPVRVRLLGEDLVAFRDSNGRLGVVGEACPHRKASLALGRNEECGLRCLYHGWKIDVEGNVVEMVSEPTESGFAQKVKHKAYPTHEAGGFVWAYMGPKEAMPEFEAPAWSPTSTTKVSIAKINIPCNWAQIMEGQIDSAHSSSLHSSDMRPARVETAEAKDTHWLRPSTDKSPRLQVQLTNYGFRYAAIRRPIKDARIYDYIRITTYVAPFTALIPPNASYNVATVLVPRDDTDTAFHFIAWSETGGIAQEQWRKFLSTQVGVELDENYRSRRTRENNFLQDRKAMKLGDFTGIPGIPNQDLAMWLTMGALADRSKERLGASDMAIVQFRRLMLDAVQTYRRSGQAIGTTQPRVPQAKIKSFQGVVPKTTNWRTLGVSEEEIAVHPDEHYEDEVAMAEAAHG